MNITPLTPHEMEDVLSSQVFGHLACCRGDTPHIYPMAYVYKDGVIYGQTTDGEKLSILHQNSKTCFHVADIQTTHWSSVLCWGHFQELQFEKLDDPEAEEGLRLIHERMSSMQDLMGIQVPMTLEGPPHAGEIDGKTTTFFRIRVTEMVGRAGGTV